MTTRNIKQLVQAAHSGTGTFEMNESEAILLTYRRDILIELWAEQLKSMREGTATFYGRPVKLIC